MACRLRREHAWEGRGIITTGSENRGPFSVWDRQSHDAREKKINEKKKATKNEKKRKKRKKNEKKKEKSKKKKKRKTTQETNKNKEHTKNTQKTKNSHAGKVPRDATSEKGVLHVV